MPKQLSRASTYPKKKLRLPVVEPNKQDLKLPDLSYNNLFELMEEGFAVCQMIYDKAGKPIDFRYLYVNPAFARQTGLPIGQVVGHTVKEVIPKIEPVWIETYNRVVQSGKSEHFENSVASLQRQFEIKVWRSGKDCFAVVFEDITQRKKAETEIKSINKKLEGKSELQEDTKRAMLNVMEDLEAAKAQIELEKAKDEAVLASIGEGLIGVDNDRKIRIMNKAAEDMLGWKLSELLGHEITKLRLEDEDGNELPLDKHLTHTDFKVDKSITVHYFVRKDKTRFPIAINVAAIKLDKKIIGAVNIFRDITREKEVDKAKNEFISLASHQLRTPLGLVKWYLEALGKQAYIKKMPTETKTYINEVYKNNERVLNLVRSMLSVSRIDQGKVKNEPKSTDVLELIKNIVQEMSIIALHKQVKLNLVVKAKKLPAVPIDPLRFHEVIENLVANAIEYNLPKGSVTVTVDKKTGKDFTVSVKDTGLGISKKDQKLLFTKFFRSEASAKNNTGGSGLGLYLVKSYIEAWGGRILVESNEGKGVTFSLTLPLIPKNI